mmetsp:Transcript_4838/g.30789  ORF Transcript_4838/g.30789 Transcript_4838/m.30789 type:complete len:110 (+) Transcript_4838:1920-2249(+)
MQPAWPKGEKRKRSFRVQTSLRIRRKCDAVSLHWTKNRRRRVCGRVMQEGDALDKVIRSNGLGIEKGKVENKERWRQTIPLYSLLKKKNGTKTKERLLAMMPLHTAVVF